MTDTLTPLQSAILRRLEVAAAVSKQIRLALHADGSDPSREELAEALSDLGRRQLITATKHGETWLYAVTPAGQRESLPVTPAVIDIKESDYIREPPPTSMELIGIQFAAGGKWVRSIVSKYPVRTALLMLAMGYWLGYLNFDPGDERLSNYELAEQQWDNIITLYQPKLDEVLAGDRFDWLIAGDERRMAICVNFAPTTRR